jgi:eukaryotic-like serine/threonine-protein kinase
MRLFFVLAACVGLTAAGATDAPMFRGDAAHSGVYAGAGSTAFGGVKWAFHAKGAFISSPAVAGDSVFVGNTDNFLYAVNRDTGALKWKFETKGRIVSSPAVASGIVYFGSYDGTFYAVNAASGALKWKFDTAGERRFAGTHLHGSEPAAETMPDPWDCYLSSPVVAGGTVFFGSGDGNVYARDAATGANRWTFKTGNVVHASPAYANGTLYIGSWGTYLYALDAKSGEKKWAFKTGDDDKLHNQTGLQSSPAVAEGTVFFGARDSHIYAVDATSGTKRWAFATSGSWVIASPAVRAGHVYAGTSDTGQMFDLDAATGKALGAADLKGWPLFSSPALSGDMLYVGSMRGEMQAIDLSGRTVGWRFTTVASKGAAAFAKPDGGLDWEKLFPTSFYDDAVAGYVKLLDFGAILASPVVADGIVYVGATDGNLYALNVKPAGGFSPYSTWPGVRPGHYEWGPSAASQAR